MLYPVASCLLDFSGFLLHAALCFPPELFEGLAGKYGTGVVGSVLFRPADLVNDVVQFPLSLVRKCLSA